TLHACGRQRHPVRGHHRRPERVHASVDAADAALSTAGEERAVPRVQVRAVCRGTAVRTSAEARFVRSGGADLYGPRGGDMRPRFSALLFAVALCLIAL